MCMPVWRPEADVRNHLQSLPPFYPLSWGLTEPRSRQHSLGAPPPLLFLPSDTGTPDRLPCLPGINICLIPFN